MVCRPCPKRVLVAVGTQPDFQAFIGNLWNPMCRPCPGRIMAMVVSRTRCVGNVRDASRPRQGCNQVISWTWCPGNFGDALGLLQGFSLISRHFQRVSGTQCVDHVQDTAGMQLDLQAFLGSFWDTMCRP
ncbi:Hypothetical predicted protein [Olea europaea subsp. europaea]|uniref:Uncharacterized protein n=1 Tax=Olea europaea subsp. europaea TaxID=158383 RepID=A0A8S0PJC9_OLEEU|nr:Hypothetical predicted protein [Olea europaea subsp. europaea]